jgi:hypothetical protein
VPSAPCSVPVATLPPVNNSIRWLTPPFRIVENTPLLVGSLI